MSRVLDHHDGSNFVRHTSCPECGSSDANAVFDDGHTYCFSCETADYGGAKDSPRIAEGLVTEGIYKSLKDRNITAETMKFFGYLLARYQGDKCQVASYYDEGGVLVGQKLRFQGKNFKWIGDSKPRHVLPFGSHKWANSGKKLVVTEGELDALAMSQVQGNKWPVVAIPTGAGRKAVRRYFANHLEYFEGWDEVVLMFDEDEAGHQATEAAAEVIGPRARVATLPRKDPGEMLAKGEADKLINCMWKATKYRPEGIVDLATLKDEVMTPAKLGLSWPFETLTDLTYGIRLGELYALGAGTGVGKTDFFTQTMMHLIREHDEKVGVFSLEQEPRETGLRLMGKLAGKPFHIPDVGTPEELEEVWEDHVQKERVFLYDSFGINEWDAIASKIRFLRDAEDVSYFFLDHLTALAAGQEDERLALDKIMAQMGSLVKEKPITIFFISHLATPQGTPHEEGGRVMLRHLRGSRSIVFWANFVFGMERDQQAEDMRTRTTTTFRVLKDRYTGRANGQVFYLGYDQETGMLYETTAPPEATAESFGFDDDFSKEEGDGSPLPSHF